MTTFLSLRGSVQRYPHHKAVEQCTLSSFGSKAVPNVSLSCVIRTVGKCRLSCCSVTRFSLFTKFVWFTDHRSLIFQWSFRFCFPNSRTLIKLKKWRTCLLNSQRALQHAARLERGNTVLSCLPKLAGCVRGDDSTGDSVPAFRRVVNSTKPPALLHERSSVQVQFL